jgi:hypothetical protein
MTHWLLVLGLLLSSTVEAAQTRHTLKKGAQKWTMTVAWEDAFGESQEAKFRLPTEEIRRDLDTPLKFKKREAGKEMARAVNRKMAGTPGVKVTARATRSGQVRISARGKSRKKLKAAMRKAEAERDAALERYLDRNGYTRLGRGIIPDHARHVQQYADDLKPVVRALGGATTDPRVFADKALSFVQSIPYEKRARISDLYRRPLSLLGRNKGDCDSKTVLYLSLLRAAYPDLPLAVVYIPGHAYGAVGLSPQRGDTKLRRKGQTWVGVEPVGPAVRPVGKLGGKSWRRAKSGRYRMRVI